MPYGIDVEELIALSHQYEREDIHTAMPGRVVTYYPDTQLADVQPMIKRPVFDDEGNRLQGESYPMLPKVPVRWPQCGGFAFVLPMKTNDFVWIEFSEGGTGEFRTTSSESEPFDVARHTITHPYCSPGAPPDSALITDSLVVGGNVAYWGILATDHTISISQTSPNIALGTNPTDFVALASKCDANFTAIKNYLTTMFTSGVLTSLIADPTSGAITNSGPAVPSVEAVGSLEVGCL